jgi:hypothetical protein
LFVKLSPTLLPTNQTDHLLLETSPKKSLNNVYPDIEFITLGEKQYKMDDWLQLLGMFISDGSTNGGAVYLSAFKQRKITFNTNILTKLELEHKYNMASSSRDCTHGRICKI